MLSGAAVPAPRLFCRGADALFEDAFGIRHPDTPRPWTPKSDGVPGRGARRRMPLDAESGSDTTRSTPVARQRSCSRVYLVRSEAARQRARSWERIARSRRRGACSDGALALAAVGFGGSKGAVAPLAGSARGRARSHPAHRAGSTASRPRLETLAGSASGGARSHPHPPCRWYGNGAALRHSRVGATELRVRGAGRSGAKRLRP